MSQTGDVEAHILRLPAEILEMVAKKLERKYLTSFRLTCQYFANSSTRLLGKYFTNKTFLLAHAPSMQALVDISQHATFKRSLKHIHLSLYVQDKRAFRLGRTRDDDEVLACRKLGGEHKKYLASLNWRRPLLTALRNISKVSAGQDITLVVGDNYDDPHGRIFCGQKTAERQLGVSFSFRMPSSIPALWSSILQTLFQARCPIATLNIGSEYWPVDLTELDHGPIYSDEDFDAVFGGMQRLQFYCKEVRLEQNANQLPHSQGFLGKMLTAPSIEKLDMQTDIGTVCRGPNPYLAAVMARAHMPCLRELDLHDGNLDEDTIINFMRRHKDTLGKVSVWIYFLDPGEADDREAPYLEAVPEVDVEFNYSPDGRISWLT
ncbi:hypothetical protein LTR17_007529 [Elasticomyces elasticus]|nr:hypothetical protein LTR17_007529 [Elasticomyces elasticus]